MSLRSQILVLTLWATLGSYCGVGPRDAIQNLYLTFWAIAPTP